MRLSSSAKLPAPESGFQESQLSASLRLSGEFGPGQAYGLARCQSARQIDRRRQSRRSADASPDLNHPPFAHTSLNCSRSQLRRDGVADAMSLSAHDRAVFHVDVQIVETLHGAGKAKLRALADAADLPQIPKDKHQGSARETIGNVNRCTTVAERDQGTSTSFENQRFASVTSKCSLLVLFELAVERVGG